MAAGEVGALGRLLHDDLVYTHSSGDTDTKAGFLERLESGSLRTCGSIWRSAWPEWSETPRWCWR